MTDLEKSQVEAIAEAELVVNGRGSVRLSAPLLERLDQLARKENRKRGNLIQAILWEYVRERC